MLKLHLKTLILPLFCFAALPKPDAQTIPPFTATVNCANSPNRIVATNMPPVASSTTLWNGVFTYANPCRRIFIHSELGCGDGSNQPRYYLDYYNFSSQNWIQWVGPTGCPIFEVPDGVWRVRGQNPIEQNGSGCEEGHINIYNNTEQWIGYKGTYDNALLVTSNIVVTGQTQQGDVVAKYKETQGTIGNALFNFGETPTLDTYGTRNYDRWWLAIFERGGLNRYVSNGWTFGFVPNNEINLEQIWFNATQSAFAPIADGVTYEVQFAVQGQCNSSWVAASLPFFGVCTQGAPPCREISDESAMILTPNPAKNSFQILGLEQHIGNSDQSLSICDVSGRVVKTYTQGYQGDFDISDLSNGIYIVTLWGGKRSKKTFKLSVVN